MVDAGRVVVEGVKQGGFELDLHRVVCVSSLLLHVHHTPEATLPDALYVPEVFRAYLEDGVKRPRGGVGFSGFESSGDSVGQSRLVYI